MVHHGDTASACSASRNPARALSHDGFVSDPAFAVVVSGFGERRSHAEFQAAVAGRAACAQHQRFCRWADLRCDMPARSSRHGLNAVRALF